MNEKSGKICIYEVGPRDGLQNEQTPVSTAEKVALINLLSTAGFSHIEATSFVSPKWVPLMADAAAVMAAINRAPDVAYAVLTPNMKGLENAVAAGADEAAVFGAASQAFSAKNINCSIDESLARFEPVAAAALDAGLKLRGYVSCVVSCPYGETVQAQTVSRVAQDLLAMGCYGVSLGDTTGTGTPDELKHLLDVVCKDVDGAQLAGHFHDTNGRALDNVAAALPYGLRTFDAAIGGLGGCPYAPGAKGNLATLSLHDFLTDAGWSTGLDRDVLIRAEGLLKIRPKEGPGSKERITGNV